MAKYLLTISLLFLVMVSFAQANKRPTKTKGLIYTREKAINLSFNSSGFSFGISKGKLKSYQTTPFWQFELGRLKHAKEFKQISDITGVRNAKPFAFGKENAFFTARLMRGQKRYLTEKAKTKGVAIGWQYMGGISLGLLKPYYLKLQRRIDPALPHEFSIERYSIDNRDVFLDSRAIVGAASFWKGVGKTKILPGLHARLGVLFDWGAFDETSRSVDAGVMIDIYPKAVPIMIDAKNYPFFLNLYINFQLGKRS